MMEVGRFLRAEAEFTGESALMLWLVGWEGEDKVGDGDAACVDDIWGLGKVAALVWRKNNGQSVKLI